MEWTERLADLCARSARCEGGSEKPMFRYYLNAIDKEKTMETCMACRGMEEEGKKTI